MFIFAFLTTNVFFIYNHILKDALWLDCGRLLLGIGVGLFSYVVISIILN